MKSAWTIVLALGAFVPAASTAQSVDYVTIRNEVTVARSADDVWRRIGDYCAIAEWMQITCDYASGNGAIGTVRRLRDATVVEPMVAQTAHSYTYWQSVGNMATASFHGTLAVEPDGSGRSRLSYALFYNQAALASDALRKSEHERLDTRFRDLLGVMKTLAEKGG